MFTIAKTFQFDAAHQLAHLPKDHPCSRLHGHTYHVTLIIEGDRDARGFAAGVDYGDLRHFKGWLTEHVDHRNLNDDMDSPTTAENMAMFVFNRWRDLIPGLVAVRISETPSTWAEYRP